MQRKCQQGASLQTAKGMSLVSGLRLRTRLGIRLGGFVHGLGLLRGTWSGLKEMERRRNCSRVGRERSQMADPSLSALRFGCWPWPAPGNWLGAAAGLGTKEKK